VQEQWKRVEIGLGRVEQVYAGRSGGSDEALYDLYSFFLNCYQLRDWLRADPKSGMSDDEVDAVIRNCVPLRVCADLANRTKHVEPLRSPWIDRNAAFLSQNVTVYVGTGTSAHYWEISAGGATYDAQDVARDCVSEWRRVLTQRGLL